MSSLITSAILWSLLLCFLLVESLFPQWVRWPRIWRAWTTSTWRLHSSAATKLLSPAPHIPCDTPKTDKIKLYDLELGFKLGWRSILLLYYPAMLLSTYTLFLSCPPKVSVCLMSEASVPSFWHWFCHCFHLLNHSACPTYLFSEIFLSSSLLTTSCFYCIFKFYQEVIIALHTYMGIKYPNVANFVEYVKIISKECWMTKSVILTLSSRS